jgi:di/tripeptidase
MSDATAEKTIDEEAKRKKLYTELSEALSDTITAFFKLNIDTDDSDKLYIIDTALAFAAIAAIETKAEYLSMSFKNCVAVFVKYFTGLAIEHTGDEEELKKYNAMLARTMPKC